MSIDPLTFVLEILNFLVLLWLLQRFLYKPVKASIAKRQSTLEQGLKDAQIRELEATKKINEYQYKLECWETESINQKTQLQQTLSYEKDLAMEQIHKNVETEKVRLQTLLEQDLSTQQQHAKEQAVKNALKLTRRMLERLASESLDELLLTVMMEDLSQLPEIDLDHLRIELQQHKGEVSLISAHILEDHQVKKLEQLLISLLGKNVSCKTSVDPDLISGIRVSIGDQLLYANLSDELVFFEKGLHHGES